MNTKKQGSRIAYHELINLFTKKSNYNFILAESFGEGYVQIYNLEKGLQVRFWNFCFREQTELYNDVEATTKEDYYTLAFFLSTQGLLFSHNDQFSPSNMVWDTVFLPNAAMNHMQLRAEAQCHCLSISFSKRWLEMNAVKDFEFLEEKLTCLSDSALYQSMALQDKKQLEELMQATWKHSFGTFYIKACVLKMLSDFFYKLRQKALHRLNLAVCNPVAEVAAYLQNNITGALPSLKKPQPQVFN